MQEERSNGIHEVNCRGLQENTATMLSEFRRELDEAKQQSAAQVAATNQMFFNVHAQLKTQQERLDELHLFATSSLAVLRHDMSDAMRVRDRKQESYHETTTHNFSELRQQIVSGEERNIAELMAANVALDEVRSEVNIEKAGLEVFCQTTETGFSKLHQVLNDVEEQNSVRLAQTDATFMNIRERIRKQEAFQESLLSELKQETLDTRDWCSTKLAAATNVSTEAMCRLRESLRSELSQEIDHTRHWSSRELEAAMETMHASVESSQQYQKSFLMEMKQGIVDTRDWCRSELEASAGATFATTEAVLAEVDTQMGAHHEREDLFCESTMMGFSELKQEVADVSEQYNVRLAATDFTLTSISSQVKLQRKEEECLHESVAADFSELRRDTATSAELISNKLLIAEASLRETTTTGLSQLREDMAIALHQSHAQFREELTISAQQSNTELEGACEELAAYRSEFDRREEGVEAKLLEITANVEDMQTKQAQALDDLDKLVLTARSGLMSRLEKIEQKIGNLRR